MLQDKSEPRDKISQREDRLLRVHCNIQSFVNGPLRDTAWGLMIVFVHTVSHVTAHFDPQTNNRPLINRQLLFVHSSIFLKRVSFSASVRQELKVERWISVSLLIRLTPAGTSTVSHEKHKQNNKKGQSITQDSAHNHKYHINTNQ